MRLTIDDRGIRPSGFERLHPVWPAELERYSPARLADLYLDHVLSPSPVPERSPLDRQQRLEVDAHPSVVHEKVTRQVIRFISSCDL